MATTLANAIGLITKFYGGAWDEVYKKEAIASMLTESLGKVRFSMDNARTVKVAKTSFGGLSDYERNNIELGTAEGLSNTRGYKEAAMSVKWETRELTMDRAAKYVIEKFDDEETDGTALMATTVEVNRTIVIPEVDAYCFSHLVEEVNKYGLGNVVAGAISTSAPLAALNAGFKWLDDNEVPENNQIAFVSTAFFNNLRSTPELYRRLDVEGPVDKKISFKIVSYEGRQLVVVPPKRFSVGFAKRPYGGYYFSAAGLPANLVSGGQPLPIDFIVMDKGAAVHVVKYDKPRILSGEAALANTDMDATVYFTRIYHDLFVFDNKVPGIYCHVGGYAGVKFADFSVILNADGIIVSTAEQPAGQLTRIYRTTRLTLPSVGDTWSTDLSTDEGIAEGTAFTAAGTYYLVGVQGGQVIAVKDLVISGTAGAFTYTLSDHA